ncbi:MAG: UDP-3-O-(3-hydroxymyristoyl)glucosamine N-acyltransferase [Proteobacteria bacterium]|nr:UDP-3-O-(3-hydroxymyristoyl)glucosamine N-acyltransferase [Pseudomonadota bacterium]
MFTLSQLAEKLDCIYRGDGDAIVNGAASITNAGKTDAVFVLSEKYLSSLEKSNAGAVVVSSELADRIDRNLLICENPHVVFASLLDIMYPKKQATGISKSASIEDNVFLGSSIFVGPNACIGSETKLADSVSIGANVVLGERVDIGKGTIVESGAIILDDTQIGSDCIIHAGAVIGADGFGYAKAGNEWIKVPQIGKVVIGDEVEIGASTTVDRGALDDTCIGNRVKIDNQIQIGHNVCIGDDTIIASSAAIAGSAKIGSRCTIGGLAGIMGHLEICDDVTIGGFSVVSKSISKPGIYSSSMRVDEISKWQKNMVRFNKLDQYAAKINTIEKRLNALEGDG